MTVPGIISLLILWAVLRHDPLRFIRNVPSLHIPGKPNPMV